MPFKNRIFLTILVIVIVALAAVLLAPIVVSNGVRLWVWWFARQEGFVATIDKVDAPFLRPIVIRQIHLKSVRDDAVRVDVTVLDARVGLNLKHVFLHLSGRDIRNISVREFHAEVHRTNPNVRALSERGWATLHRLLPETLSIAKLETRVENGRSLILLRNASITGRLRVAPPTFRWRRFQMRLVSPTASTVCSMPATSRFAATWPNRTAQPRRCGVN